MANRRLAQIRGRRAGNVRGGRRIRGRVLGVWVCALTPAGTGGTARVEKDDVLSVAVDANPFHALLADSASPHRRWRCPLR